MRRILKWSGATLAVLIATIMAAFVGTRGNHSLAHVVTGELRVIPDVGHDVIWDNPSASLNVIRIFLNARNWQ
jgi:hypothetical protein